jgi:hypothetical protein
MRRVSKVFFRGFAVVAVTVVLAANVSAAPRERGKDKAPIIVKLLRIVRALGDGLTVPLP